MNKKVNTLLFVLGATLFNIIVAIISFILFTVIYAKFIMNMIPESGRGWGFTLIFLAAIAVSFFVYRYVLKYLLTKVNIEEYFDPIFVRKHKRKSGSE
ncbi:MAG: leader peptide processing enzyme [Treponema sp.]|jgi:hypothetical protein|nr:leader peptide processing enzyme [Treponema sp.]